MIEVRTTDLDDDLKGILNLQKANLSQNISIDEKKEQGFVTVNHNLIQLQKMVSFEPHVVAINDGKVIGYVLSMVKEMRNEFPEIAPMFDMLPNINFKGKPLTDYRYLVCGQACVDKDFRGLGIVGKLYEKMKLFFESSYTLCITEIATRNIRSMKAHGKVGFQSVKTYNDGNEDWELVVWDWKNS